MLRRASREDHAWIVELGAEVYRDLGDYTQVLPSWLAEPGVLAWIDSDLHGNRRGFALLGFYLEDGLPVADLLAIGVAEPYRRRGIGRSLLEHVVAVAVRVGPSHQIDELRLTVAEHNSVSRRMYEQNGFRDAQGGPGSYASGERAIRMVRPLRPLP